MKITLKQLRDLIIETTSKESKKEFKSPFNCPRHHLSLLPRWQKVDVTDQGKKVDNRDQFAKYKYIQPPTRDRPDLIPSDKKKRKSIIRFWYCPLYEQPGDNDGHECDYRVTARVQFPGQKHPNIALGQVANELGIGWQPVTKSGGVFAIPTSLDDMVKKMFASGFHWKRVGDNKSTKFEKIPQESGQPVFTQDDITFLSYIYPMSLEKEAKTEGYAGPKPYEHRVSASQVFQHLRAEGFEIAEPEDKRERSVSLPGIGGGNDSLKRSLSSGGWWVDDDNDSDFDDPWAKDDTKDDEVDISLDPVVVPDRWK